MPMYEDRFRINNGAEDVRRNLDNSHNYVPQAKVDFWWARDLLLSAGYRYVDDTELERCVGYAVVCLTSADIDPRYHVCRWTRHFPTIQTAGYDRKDYFLSSYACYWAVRCLPVVMPFRQTAIDYFSGLDPIPNTHCFHVLDKRGWPVTEITHYCNQRDLHDYRRFADETVLDPWSEYLYMSVLDFKTCRQCRELDGQIFRISDAVPGINFPPMHPGCRSTTGPVVDREGLQRMTRKANDPISGETMHLPPGSNYYTWFRALIDKYGEETVRAAREAVLREPATLPPYLS